MIELDIPTLSQIISQCFANARNNRDFNADQRLQWWIKGAEYKQLLVRTINKSISEELGPKVRDANQRLSAIGQRLKDVQETLRNYNKTIEELIALADIIGQILDLATSLIPASAVAELAFGVAPAELLTPIEGATGSDPDIPSVSASKLLVRGQGTLSEFLAMPTGAVNAVNIVPPYASSPLPLESIVGRDDRVRILDTGNAPWRMICSLSIQGPRGGFVGTGWFAGPKTIITAAHCLYEERQMGGRALQIQISPGRDGDNFPYPPVVSRKFEVPEEWIASRGTNPDFDYGVIFLDEPIGERTGWFSVAVADDHQLNGAFVNLSGYPGDAAGGLGIYQLFHADRIANVAASRFYYAIDTYGGQSGAPVWLELENGNRQVTGIHTYGIGGSFQLNSATRITPTILADIQQWLNKP